MGHIDDRSGTGQQWKSEIKEGDPSEVHDDAINEKQAYEPVGMWGLDTQKRSKTGRYASVHIWTCSDGGSMLWVADDVKYLQTHNDPGVLSGLVLGVIELCGDGDDGMSDFVSKGCHTVRG